MDTKKLTEILKLHKAWVTGIGEGKCAYLRSANLYGATLNWQSHAILGELLQRSASTLDQRSVAGVVSKSTDWCWDDFEREFSDDQKAWAKSVLAHLVKEGDGAPEILKADKVGE